MIYILLLIQIIAVVLGSPPVWCPKERMVGSTWKFVVSDKVERVNLYETDQVCTHQTPNALQIVKKNQDWKFPSSDEMIVVFNDSSNCQAALADKTQSEGKWYVLDKSTLVIELDNKQRYVVSFRYNYILDEPPMQHAWTQFFQNFTGKTELQQKFGNEQSHQAIAIQNKIFEQNCDQTMVGFVQDTTQSAYQLTGKSAKKLPIQCFYGYLESRGPMIHKHIETEVHVNDTEFKEDWSNRTYIEKDLDEDKPKSDLMSKNINTNRDLLAHPIDQQNTRVSQVQVESEKANMFGDSIYNDRITQEMEYEEMLNKFGDNSYLQIGNDTKFTTKQSYTTTNVSSNSQVDLTYHIKLNSTSIKSNKIQTNNSCSANHSSDAGANSSSHSNETSNHTHESGSNHSHDIGSNHSANCSSTSNMTCKCPSASNLTTNATTNQTSNSSSNCTSNSTSNCTSNKTVDWRESCRDERQQEIKNDIIRALNKSVGTEGNATATSYLNQTSRINASSNVSSESNHTEGHNCSCNSTENKTEEVDLTPKSMIKSQKIAVGIKSIHNDYGIPMGNPFDGRFTFNNSARCTKSDLETGNLYALKWQEKYDKPHEIKDWEIPKEYDLNNVHGVSYITAPYGGSQNCNNDGVRALVTLAQSRLAIRYGYEKVPELSVAHNMACNYLNDGCNGGSAYLAGVFSEQVGFVDKKCAPFRGSDFNLKSKKDCSSYKDCKMVARATKSYFIDGSNVKAVQKEILYNGPVLGTTYSQVGKMRAGFEAANPDFNQTGDTYLLQTDSKLNSEPLFNDVQNSFTSTKVISGWFQQGNKTQWIFEDYQSVDSFTAGINYQGLETSVAAFDFELMEIIPVWDPLAKKK